MFLALPDVPMLGFIYNWHMPRSMVEGNSPRIRNELKEAATLMPKSKGLAYWLARYEVMAGHYRAAFDAIKDSTNYPPVRHNIMPLASDPLRR